MSRIFVFFTIFSFWLTSILNAQNYNVNFLKGSQKLESNLSDFTTIKQLSNNEIFGQNFYRFIQFKSIPTISQQKQIESVGIQLLEYIPNFVYVASIPVNINFNSFKDLNIRGIYPIEYTYKVCARLENEDYPDWAIKGNGILVNILVYQNIDLQVANDRLNELGIHIQSSMNHANMVIAHVLPSKLKELVNSAFVRYVEVISEPGRKESDDGRHLHRSNAINGDFYGSRNYDGTGISFSVNDDGIVGPHIDFKGRVNQQEVAGNFGGTHGDMVAGIAGGAGNLDPLMRGMAPGSYMHIREYNSSMSGTIQLHQDSAVLIFSSSYSNGCNGGYTTTTALVDQEIYNNPNLMQTFSAGNSNFNDCGYGAGNQWGNITGGHKIGKNVIATANLDNEDVVASNSSRGPASDGRIKPDISAHGSYQMSTDPNNAYAPGQGTSAAAPGICGVMAQMHHAYQALNGGSVASSALLKATLLNTANDLGNDGPDFIYGWGKVNALKAIQLLEDHNYFNDSVSQGNSNSHSINIPTGVQRAKIMVYWTDKEASTSAAISLVNDLDAVITDPLATSHLPWLLDHTPNPTTLALPAIKGSDHLNNIEQIAIDTPLAGTYIIEITGSTVPFGPQEYFVVYEFLMDDLTVIHPMGGEGLIPGSIERIHWDAYGTSGTFLIEYTEDNGTTWNVVADNIAGDRRFFNWNVPVTITGQARVRISRGGSNDESDANFTILERPQNIIINRVCSSVNEIQLAWDSVPGATGYDVFILGQTQMDSIGTTSALTFNVPVTDINDEQWFSVRALGPNGIRGLRQIAVHYAGISGGSTCFLSCSGDNDAGIRSINSPSSLIETCASLGTTIPVTVTLENIGLFTESNFPIYYQLGSNPVVTEIYTNNLIAGDTNSYTFTTPITIPVAGIYDLKVWTGLINDSTSCNDTITMTVNVLVPQGNFPYTENFESGIFPPIDSYIINPDNDMTWQLISTIGSAGTSTSSMYVNNFDYNGAGEEDIFSFVSLDMTQAAATANAYLTFDVAYRQYSSNYSDDLRIDLSTDCGQTFTQVYFKDGQNLATGNTSTTSWSPSSDLDWRNDTVDLSSYVGNEITLRFVNISGWGNNLYVDNINVELLGALPPIANFKSDVSYTCDGIVTFEDISGNSPSQWLWDFGDGNTSTQQNPSHTYLTSGIYNVSLQVTNSLGVDLEIKNAYVTVEIPEVMSVNNGVGCSNSSILLSANSIAGDLYWYDSVGALIHVGPNFNTPQLTTTTNYQVQNIILTPTLSAGPLIDTSVGVGGYHSSGFTGGINFTAFNEFELISVWIDADGAGPRTITLWDGNVLNGGTLPTNPIIATTTVNVLDGTQRIFLNFQIPGPGDYCLGGNNVNLYRNNAGTNYPYTLPDVLSMTSSTANNPFNYYYYFYDWNLRLDSCASPISSVTAEVINADFAYTPSGATVAFTDNSTGAISWLWDFGDGNTSSQQNPIHTYTSNGPHMVTLSINNGACVHTSSVSLTTSVQLISNSFNAAIVPNPATDETVLYFSEALNDDLTIQIVDVHGRVLHNTTMPAGTVNQVLNLRDLRPAMYMVCLNNNDFIDIRRIIVQ